MKVNWPTQFLDVGGTQIATEMYNKNRDKFGDRMKKNIEGKPRISIKDFEREFQWDISQPKAIEQPKAKEEVLEPKEETNGEEETIQETKEEVEEEKPTKKTTKKSWWGKKK